MNQYFVEIYEKVGLNKNDAIKFASQVQKEYKNISKWYLYEDVIPSLEYLTKTNYKNIILSNHIPELDEIIENLGIKKYFLKIYTSGIIGYEKPNIKIFDYVINNLQVEKKECIMIGDSYDADILGALRVGIKAILVRKPNDKNYELYCANVKEILKIVENMSI